MTYTSLSQLKQYENSSHTHFISEYVSILSYHLIIVNKMPSKKFTAHLIKAKELARQRKAEIKDNITASAEYYARENCEYNLKSLCETVPKALNSVTVSAIFYYYQHCIKTIEAYCSELEYRTKQFPDEIYSGHKVVVNK